MKKEKIINPVENFSENLSNKINSFLEPATGFFFTLLFFILFNIFYDDIRFLTSDFDKIKTLYNITLIVGIIFHFSRIFFHSKIYKLITEIINNILFCIVAYQLWVIFPFDTSVIGDPQLWDKLFRIFIIIPTLSTVFTTIIELIKFVTGKK